MVRWLRWHCPPGFEIRALVVWGRARYLSVTEAPHNTDFTRGWGKNIFCFFEITETGIRTLISGVKGSGANHYPRAPALEVMWWGREGFVEVMWLGMVGFVEVVWWGSEGLWRWCGDVASFVEVMCWNRKDCTDNTALHYGIQYVQLHNNAKEWIGTYRIMIIGVYRIVVGIYRIVICIQQILSGIYRIMIGICRISYWHIPDNNL